MRILIALDAVTVLEPAVRLGWLVHQATGGTLTVLMVIKNEKARQQAEGLLAKALALIEPDDPAPQTHIRIGELVEEISAEVEARKINLVIVGERFRNRFLKRLVSPFTEKVIGDVSCSILFARGQPRPIQRVLLCEGGHDPSLLNGLIDHLPTLLEQIEHLTILHVMSQIAAGPGVAGWELRADAEDLIEKGTPEGSLLGGEIEWLKKMNIHPEAKVRHGLVVTEILAEAQRGEYDLVVIGAHPTRGWERYLLDDLAHQIIDHIDRPLLVIKR